MIQEKENVGRLQEWILVEAYNNGESRKKKESATGEPGTEVMADYSIHRDDIYRRYFKLPKDGLSREVRLQSVVIFCESVNELLKNRLIQFPNIFASKKKEADLQRLDAGRLLLTEAGVRRAKSLLSGGPGPESEDRLEGRCAA